MSLSRRRLAIDSSSVVTHADDAFAPVCLLQVSLKMEGEERQGSQVCPGHGICSRSELNPGRVVGTRIDGTAEPQGSGSTSCL